MDTGRELRLVRLRYELSQRQVGAAMGVSRERVRQIEATRRPTDQSARRYLTAVLVASTR